MSTTLTERLNQTRLDEDLANEEILELAINVALEEVHDRHPEAKYATIMIVDDEPLNIKTVQKHLELRGYVNFVTTTNSATAYSLIQSKRPDVILLDVMMPEVNGLDILRKIQAEDGLKSIPVIILTAYCDEETKREALESGATDFLAKPVDASELIPRVKNALAVKANQDQLEDRVRSLSVQVFKRTKELVASRQEAQQRYLAGKAEIASEVLHNVGNALQSVNTAAGVVFETLRESKLASLGKAVALIEKNRNNLAAFFSRDNRGRKLPDFIRELAQQLSVEQRTILSEVEALMKHLDHIKAIVLTQQKYAGVSTASELVSLNSLLLDAEGLCGITPDIHGITVTRELDAEIEFQTDKQRLLQILVNLLKNAYHSLLRKQPPSGGRLTIHTAKDDEGNVQIDVGDNGEGIEPEKLSEIFQHGYTTKQNGHGFGLHSCANMAKEIGGTIHAYSEGRGTGAVFSVRIPLQPRSN